MKIKLGEDYVVSDIHGCYSLLEEELEKLGFNRSFILCWKSRLFSIKGNHEDMIIRAFNNFETMTVYVERNGNS